MIDFLNSERPLFLSSIQVPKGLRVLMLAPHPDDFDAIGITMRYLRDNGNEIFVAVLSSGASGIEGRFLSYHPNKSKPEIREDEQRESCKFFGLSENHLTFLRLEEDPQGQIKDDLHTLEMVRDTFSNIRPNWVFLPHGHDTNLGHERSFSIFTKIANETEYPLTAFLNRDPKTIATRSDMYAVFSEKEMEWKRQLLLFHQSQHQRNLNTRGHGFDDRILGFNRRIALEELDSAGYAEAFEIRQFNSPHSKCL
ncbi:MAG: PIG-L family deacetylase [Pseudomonadota bacterium]